MIRMDISKVTILEARQGTGNWGVKLGPGDVVAYECPMLGDGGAGGIDLLARLLSNYAEADGADPLYVEDGPDEILYRNENGVYLLTISVE